MKNILFLSLLIFAGYKGWGMYQSNVSLEPLMNESYVAVYGRDSCGWTQQAIKDLKQHGINYTYYKIDEKQVADFIHHRMEAFNISTRRYNLPVIDVNGKIFVRPDIKDILASYNEKL